MNTIFAAVILVGGISLVAGLGLSIASIIMRVPEHKPAQPIRKTLPGSNCGACGFASCDNYAQAVAVNNASANLCIPGGKKTSAAISGILEIDTKTIDATAAIVKCNGTCEHTKDKMEYQGISSCFAATQFFSGQGSCTFSCIGFGDCAAACKFGAITLCGGVAVIHPEKCNGCGMCARSCPKQSIDIIPVNSQAVVACNNRNNGSTTRKICAVGCIGCKLCVKKCNFNAITVDHSLAVINSKNCTACGDCVDVCPQNSIYMFEPVNQQSL